MKRISTLIEKLPSFSSCFEKQSFNSCIYVSALKNLHPTGSLLEASDRAWFSSSRHNQLNSQQG